MTELLDKHTDELVEVEPGVYQQAARVARRLTSSWPGAAIESLQENRRVLAARQWYLLSESTDAGELERFTRRYFMAPQGALAAQRSARLALEAGLTDVARLRTEDLLTYHPLRLQNNPAWKLLHCGVLQLSGRNDAAAQLVQSMTLDTQGQIDWNGTSAPASQIARQMLALQPLPPTSQPTGDVRDGAKLTVLWQANLTNQPGYGLSKQDLPAHWLPVPIVLAQPSLVLIQWDRHCAAFEPTSGTWMWDSCPLSDKEATRAGASGSPAPRRPAVWQERVYVVTEVPAAQGQPGPLKAPQALLCLDAVSGKPYWVRTAADMMSRSDPAVLDGTPIADDGRVYLAGRVIRTGGYHEIHLLVIDARTGVLLNRMPLFGVARPEYTPNDRIKPVRLGLSRGILYAISTAGACAAIDTQSLQPIWMRSFRPNGPASQQAADEVREPDMPSFWGDEPLLSADQMLVPVDMSLQLIDRWTGQSARTVALGAPVQALASDREGQAAVLARGVLYTVDVSKGAIVRKLDTKDRGTAGMAALAAGRFLASQTDHLRIVQPGAADQALPVDYVPAGIPAIAGDRILLGSDGYLTCLGDAQKPLSSLQDQMRSDQGAGPAVRLVELSLRMGQPDVALDAMHRAVQQGAADPKRSSGQVVCQLYEICLAFGKHYSHKAGQENRKVASELLAVASRCAADARQRILCHAATADLAMASKKLAEAVAGWQAILTDDALRTAPLPEDLGGANTTAGAWAQTRIAELMARHGRDPYSAFDAGAEKLLQSANQSNDRKTFEDMLARYPNSSSVPQAWLAIGGLAVTSGDAKGALDPLRKAATLADFNSQAQVQAMIQLSQAYENLGSTQAAATWMGRLAMISPQAAVEVSGKTLPASKYAVMLAGRISPAAPVSHQLDVPLQGDYLRMFGEAVSLVKGRAAQQVPANLVLVWSGGLLRGLDAQRGRQVWQQPVQFKTECRLLAADKSQVVLQDKYRVVAVESATGQAVWTWSAGGPDPDAPNVDPESVPTIEEAAGTSEVVLVLTADKKTTCLDRLTGRVRWQIAQSPAFVANLAVSEDLAVYRGNQASRLVYAVLDVRTGQRVSMWEPSRNVPAEAVEILPAATVMLISAGAIEGYDAYCGTMFWQVYPQGRFRTALRSQADTSLYIAEGERHVARIDTLAGKALWRAQMRERLGSVVDIVPGDGAVWVAAERGCQTADDQTGKVLEAITMPREVPTFLEIREAALCQTGLVCLVAQHGQETSQPAPPMVVMFEAKEGTASVVATLVQAMGVITGWQVEEGAVIVAAGSRLIGVTSK